VSLEVGLAIGVLLLLVALRAPGILMHGRFWAEEGTLFGAIQERSLLGQLFHLKSGQLLLLLNISLTLAAHASLVHAPRVTTYFGVLALCGLAGLLVGFRRALGIDFPAALLVSVLMLTSPVASEHFANSTNVQWIASAAVMILILLPGDMLRAHLGSLLPLVVLLGLSGMPAASLAPVALLFALARRSRMHALIGVALAICAAIELVLVVRTFWLPGRTLPIEPDRTLPVEPYIYVAASFLQVVVKHFLGIEAAGALGEAFRHGTVSTRSVWAFLVLPTALLAASGWFVWRNWRHPLALALVSTGYVIGFNVFGSTGEPRGMIGVGGMRYFFLPTVIALLTVGSLLSSPRVLGRVSVATCILALVAAVSTADFFGHPYFNGFASDRPSWRAELARCPAPPKRCRAAISPPGWFVDIRTSW
jgi:hypothetical protein